jgi:hypothetical protein
MTKNPTERNNWSCMCAAEWDINIFSTIFASDRMVDDYDGFRKKISDGWPGVFIDNIDAVNAWPEGSQFKGKA